VMGERCVMIDSEIQAGEWEAARCGE
jgi:hypothetical protein